MNDNELERLFDELREYVNASVVTRVAEFAEPADGDDQRWRQPGRGVLWTVVAAGTAVAVALVVVLITVGLRHSVNEPPASPVVPPATANQLANGHWVVIPNPPRPLCGGSESVWTGSEMLLWGGEYEQRPCGYGLGFDPLHSKWRQLPTAPIPGAISGTSAWTGREFVVVGGYTDSKGKNWTASAAAYNPSSNTWRKLPSFPLGAQIYASSGWDGHHVLVFGGRSESPSPAKGTALEGYDPARNRWQRLASAPFAVDAVSIETKVVVEPDTLLAATVEPDPSAPAGLSQAVTKLLIYNSRTNSWTVAPKATDGTTSFGTMVAVPGGVIGTAAAHTICLGCSGPIKHSAPRLLRFDVGSKTWTALAQQPAVGILTWTGAALANVNNSSDKRALPATNTAWNPDTNTWQPLSPSPFLFNYAPAVWTGKELLIVGKILANPAMQAPPSYLVGGGIALLSNHPLPKPVPLPTFTLTPAQGPVGTQVAFTGQLTPAQVTTWGNTFTHPSYFTLITELADNCEGIPAGSQCAAAPSSLHGCELLLGLTNATIHLDDATGHVSGSFRVGTQGACFQTRPVAAVVSALPGRYVLAIGAHAEYVGYFTLTK